MEEKKNLTPFIWGEDPDQNYPEETQEKQGGSSIRKLLCIVLGPVTQQRTRSSIFGNYCG